MLDTDGDGITDMEELNVYGTDPYNMDTDGDGYHDLTELILGLNPLERMTLVRHGPTLSHMKIMTWY